MNILLAGNDSVAVPHVKLPRLVTHGSFFETEAGEGHTLIDASSFMSNKKFLEHDGSLVPHFEQLQELRFNTARVFLMCRNMWQFNPTDYPDFYKRLPESVIFAATYGLYSNLVVFPDCALVMPDQSQQLEHWARIGDALLPVSDLCLVSLQNEADQPPNRINSAAFQPLPGLLCSHGSNGSRAAPVRPWWQWEEYHINNEVQWWREPHNAMEFSTGDAEGHIEGSHVPMHISESKRPDNDAVVSHFRDTAECASLLIAGSCFHSQAGKVSGLLAGHELMCAQAWVKGAMAIPLHCQPGAYTHRRDLEHHVNCPAATGGRCTCGERAYQRGSEDACIAHSLKTW